MKERQGRSLSVSVEPSLLKEGRDVRRLGQVFTPENIVLEMLALRKNTGAVLEPSCGTGAFFNKLKRAAGGPSRLVGLEIDPSLRADKAILLRDFFSYPTENQFDTVIGNPPYVRHQDILPETRRLLDMKWFDRRSNLYLFFIAKSLSHLRKGGELIFITPRDFLKASSAKRLNQELYKQGAIAYYKELGDVPIFRGYAPNCAIWRWEKGRRDRRLESGQGWFNHTEGQLWLGRRVKSRRRLSDLFEVKVGAVSGADHIFANRRRGNVDMVCSKTAATGQTRRMICNRKDRSLLPHKKELLSRKIRAFHEDNWWEWGRRHCEREQERVYVNCKTRNPKPFFTHPSKEYDGAVMALFPKNRETDVQEAADKLNRISWAFLGFECGGRLLFTQRSLSNAPLDIQL